MSARSPAPLSAPRPEDQLSNALADALTAAVPAATVATILERYADAHKPQECRIIAVVPNAISVTYLQPVREYWYKPLNQTQTVLVYPALPAVGADTARWIADVAARLERFAETKAVPVAVFLPPRHWTELGALAFFLGFSLLIAGYLAGASLVVDYIFTSERRFNIAMAVHCGVIVKRSRDYNDLSDLLAAHWKGSPRDRFLWVMCTWIEGWRAVSRFKAEATRQTILLAETEEVESTPAGKKSKKKAESKKKI